jgi:hypothetical protein
VIFALCQSAICINRIEGISMHLIIIGIINSVLSALKSFNQSQLMEIVQFEMQKLMKNRMRVQQQLQLATLTTN